MNDDDYDRIVVENKILLKKLELAGKEHDEMFSEFEAAKKALIDSCNDEIAELNDQLNGKGRRVIMEPGVYTDDVGIIRQCVVVKYVF